MPQLNVLGRWLGVTNHTDTEQTDLRLLKAALARHGVNSRGWRLYIDHGDAMFRPLISCAHTGVHRKAALAARAVAWLRVLQACEMDVLPPPELVRGISDWGVPGDDLLEIPPLFLRAAWKAVISAQYETRQPVGEFVEESILPLAQWFFASGTYKTTGPERLKAGWESLRRLHRESLAAQVGGSSGADWPPIVQRYASGPFVLMGLSREADLVEEGTAMLHCVGTYGDRCRHEPLRIYSIRRQKCGTRVATLSVREAKPGYWVVDQVKGPANAKVGNLLWPEIDGLLQLLNAESIKPKVRSYLNLVRAKG